MAGPKSSKLEMERRIFTIQGWIVNGTPDYLILKNIEEKFKNINGQNVCRKTAKNLLKKAYTVWCQEQEATIEQRRTMRIAGLEQDIRNMKESYKGTPQGMSVVNSIKKEISKLEGLYPARTHIIQGDKDKPLVITEGFSEEKQARLDKLMEKVLSIKQQ
jgi:hypothetical protein